MAKEYEMTGNGKRGTNRREINELKFSGRGTKIEKMRENLDLKKREERNEGERIYLQS